MTLGGSISGQSFSDSPSVGIMFSKVLLSAVFFVAAVARPDKLPTHGYQYQPPKQSYAPPRPTYSPPTTPKSVYSPPTTPEAIYSPPVYTPPVAPSAPEPTYSAPEEMKLDMPMPFEYAYAVKDDESGSEFTHNTDSDGSHTTGEYRVLLPDGRTQIVTYTVTKEGGYVAEVTYEGEAIPYIPPQKDDSFEEISYSYQASQEPQPTYEAPEEPQPTYPVPQRTYGANF